MYLKATPKHSLFFAPMEGVTDQSYRLTIHKLYPQWDFYCTDFLRAPTESYYPLRIVKEHIGEKILANNEILKKTIFQILATPRTTHQHLVSQIQDLGILRVDLNLGCPSKTVNNHFGGAYLLSDLPKLVKIAAEIRQVFHGIFTVKMRVGYRDDLNFLTILKSLEDLGVDAITIHARTRDQLYTGIANWNYIKTATQSITTPIIGNGDVWAPCDLENIFKNTECHGVMMGRGALKSPWFPILNQNNSPQEMLQIRKNQIPNYFLALIENYSELFQNTDQKYSLLKRLKSLCRYLFEDFENANEMRSIFLRSENMNEFLILLNKLHSGELEAELMEKKNQTGAYSAP